MQWKKISFGYLLAGALCLQAAATSRHMRAVESRTFQSRLNHFRGGRLSSSDFESQKSSDYSPEYYQDVEPPTHETTVQDNIDTWRAQQRQRAEATQHSMRDDQGRVKLLTSVGKGSRALIFFVLMLRDIHLYEVADASRKGLARLLCVTPLIALFLSNMVGAFASLASPTHATKKRLKAILNLDKALEVVLMVFYLLRLTIFPPAHIPRETFIANIFHSVFFILQAQTYTRLSWDETAAPSINSYAVPNNQLRQFSASSYNTYGNQPEAQTFQPTQLGKESSETSNYP
ncbi:hypothetical protein FisN_3Hu401 [Fistulifera solaris]|uniref:Uncharacterized protein n=1 Tax=Fistulifera solaris TaxID=1519565 RepID=A0A1Z5JQR5_FISSO|nr:hypothetical protein FisN_3Hu401 [Fistulifera solaris]|eukprot:GAX16118.1 hypothetical protein FisN_3Hu401 [Fistulifera solaris]